MSGAVWVRDRLQACGWSIQIADARKVKAIAPLACKTDRVDARVLAELVAGSSCRPSGCPRSRSAPIVSGCADAHISSGCAPRRSTAPSGCRLSGDCGATSPRCASREPWMSSPNTVFPKSGASRSPRCSASSTTSIASLRRSSESCDHTRAPTSRVQLLMTIPGVAELLGLTLAAEIGEVSRFAAARKLVGYSGLAPTIKQSGQSSRTGRISKAGPNTLRWAAVEAASRPGGPPIRGIDSTATSSAATASPTPPRPPSRARSSSPPGTSCRCKSPSSRAPLAPPTLSRQAPPFVWPPDGPQTI